MNYMKDLVQYKNVDYFSLLLIKVSRKDRRERPPLPLLHSCCSSGRAEGKTKHDRTNSPGFLPARPDRSESTLSF